MNSPRNRAQPAAKYADYIRHISPEGALTLMSGWTGVDLSTYDLDQRMRHVRNDAGRTAMDNITRADPVRAWRLQLLKELVPGLAQVAVLTNPMMAAHATFWEHTEVAARTVGVALQPLEVR